jgi:hypothetical protein
MRAYPPLRQCQQGSYTPAIVGVLLLLVCVGLFLYFYKPVDREFLGSFKGEARTNRLYAFERWLKQLNAPYTHVKGALAFDALSLKAGDTVILNEYRLDAMTPSRINKMWDWVESGGHLIVIPEQGESDRLLEDYGVTRYETRWGRMFGRQSAFVPVSLPHVSGSLTVGFGYSHLSREDGAFAPSLQVKASTGSVYQLLAYQRGDGVITVIPTLGFLKGDSLADKDNAEFAWSLLTMPRKLPDREQDAEEEPEGEGSGKSYLNYEPWEKPEESPRSPQSPEEAAKQAAEKAAHEAIATAMGSGKSGAAATRSTGTTPMSAPAFRASTPGSVFFVDIEGSGSLMKWLIQVAPVVMGLLVLFCLLWLMRVIPRFGPVALPEAINRASLREHFAATGHFLMREGASESLLLATRKDTIKQFELHLPGWNEVPKVNRPKWLADTLQTGIDPRDIELAFNFSPPDKTAFLRYMQILALLRQKASGKQIAAH